MHRAVLLLFFAVPFLSCQRDPAGPTSTNLLGKGDLVGFWAEYKHVVTNDYVDGAGQRVNNTLTVNDSSAISDIYHFDTASVVWYSALNNPVCYTRRDSCSCMLSGDTLNAKPFEGFTSQGSDTLWAINLVSKKGGELIIQTTMAGTWNGQPGHFTTEYHYCKLDTFPPPYWPGAKCY